MILDIETAKQVAKSLLQIKAIILNPDEPFVWASGWHSPIYCDNRISLSHCEVRTFIRHHLVEGVLSKYGIDPSLRPQNLDLTQWVSLSNIFS